MKGGFNNPPNEEVDVEALVADAASMKGGFNNPPNKTTFHNPAGR